MKYVKVYLIKHSKIKSPPEFEFLLVRQLEQTSEGLPIQIYAYSTTGNWIEHEEIQAEIMDHILAIMPMFKLRSFQHISSNSNFK